VSWIFWLYVIGGAAFSACALVYGLRSPWYRSPMGIALEASWTSLAAVLILAVLLHLFPLRRDVAVGLSITVMTAVDVTALVLLVTVLRLQRRGRDEPTPRRRATDHR
jgi:hypothetical protein